MTIDEELRRLDPAADLPSYTDAELETMLRAARGRTSGRPWVRWASVAAALVLAVALTVNSIGGNPQQAAAAETLRQAARALPTDTAEPSQYIKVTTESRRVDRNEWPDKKERPDAWFQADYTSTQYVPVDPTRHGLLIYLDNPRFIRQVYGPPMEFLPASTRIEVTGPETEDDHPLSPSPGYEWSGPPMPIMEFLAGLPTDNAALRAEIYEGLDHLDSDEADAEAFHRIQDFLRLGLTPPDIAAQFYEILAAMPGIRQAPDPVQMGDVAGVAIGHIGRPHDVELVFADDGRLLGWQRTWSADGWVYEDLPDGNVTAETYEILTTEIVDELPADILAKACSTDGYAGTPSCYS